MWTLSSPCQFVLSPALHWTLTTCGGDFRPLQLLQIAAVVPVVVMTFLLKRLSKEKVSGRTRGVTGH